MEHPRSLDHLVVVAVHDLVAQHRGQEPSRFVSGARTESDDDPT